MHYDSHIRLAIMHGGLGCSLCFYWKQLQTPLPEFSGTLFQEYITPTYWMTNPCHPVRHCRGHLMAGGGHQCHPISKKTYMQSILESLKRLICTHRISVSSSLGNLCTSAIFSLFLSMLSDQHTHHNYYQLRGQFLFPRLLFLTSVIKKHVEAGSFHSSL